MSTDISLDRLCQQSRALPHEVAQYCVDQPRGSFIMFAAPQARGCRYGMVHHRMRRGLTILQLIQADQ